MLTLAVVAAAAPAPAPPAVDAPAAAEVVVPPPAIDPNAILALENMGVFLNRQTAFEVRGRIAKDEILSDSGQKIQLSRTIELSVKRPDRLRAEVTSDRKHRQLFYDGKTFTIFAPREGYYAQAPAPATVGELVEEVEGRFGIEVPLVDLFYWGTEQSGVDDIESAMAIGPAEIGGVKCMHYALRQQDVDWQIWIAIGKEPLPRKLVITTTSEPEQPQYVAELDWKLKPKLPDALFTFVPPKGTHRIVFDEDAQAAAGGSP